MGTPYKTFKVRIKAESLDGYSHGADLASGSSDSLAEARGRWSRFVDNKFAMGILEIYPSERQQQLPRRLCKSEHADNRYKCEALGVLRCGSDCFVSHLGLKKKSELCDPSLDNLVGHTGSGLWGGQSAP